MPDDRIVFGSEADRHMLLHNAVDHRSECRRIVDVGGIGKHRGGERLLLAAVGLVAHVEQVRQFRMGFKHVAVEGASNGNAVIAQDRNTGVDIRTGCC